MWLFEVSQIFCTIGSSHSASQFSRSMFSMVTLQLVHLSVLPPWEENVCQSPREWMQHEWRLHSAGLIPGPARDNPDERGVLRQVARCRFYVCLCVGCLHGYGKHISRAFVLRCLCHLQVLRFFFVLHLALGNLCSLLLRRDVSSVVPMVWLMSLSHLCAEAERNRQHWIAPCAGKEPDAGVLGSRAGKGIRRRRMNGFKSLHEKRREEEKQWHLILEPWRAKRLRRAERRRAARACRAQQAANIFVRVHCYTAWVQKQVALARLGFEQFHNIPSNSADIQQLQRSSAGIAGWASFAERQLGHCDLELVPSLPVRGGGKENGSSESAMHVGASCVSSRGSADGPDSPHEVLAVQPIRVMAGSNLLRKDCPALATLWKIIDGDASTGVASAAVSHVSLFPPFLVSPASPP